MNGEGLLQRRTFLYLHIESTVRSGVQLICIVIVTIREWRSADREYRQHLLGVKL